MALPILQSDTFITRPIFDDILQIRVLKDDEGSEDGQEEGVERQVHVEILPKGLTFFCLVYILKLEICF